MYWLFYTIVVSSLAVVVSSFVVAGSFIVVGSIVVGDLVVGDEVVVPEIRHDVYDSEITICFNCIRYSMISLLLI